MKTAEVVARRIVRDATAAGLGPGDALENEAAMVSTYGVARGTLREALRLLESQGILEIKPGLGGGPVLRPMHPRELGRVLALHLQAAGVTYEEVARANVAIEALMAELAAATRDPAGWGDGEVEGVDDRADHRFHEWVHARAGNGALELLAGAVGSVMAHHLRMSVDTDLLAMESIDDHRAILGAILAGDPSAAGAAMREHWNHTFERARSEESDFFDTVVEWL
jgi:GntR family transcriptional repressor for pyruvate dehydrogenase complex